MQFSIREMLWLTSLCGVLLLTASPAGPLSQAALVAGCLVLGLSVWVVSAALQRQEAERPFVVWILLGSLGLTAGLLLGGLGLGESFRVILTSLAPKL